MMAGIRSLRDGDGFFHPLWQGSVEAIMADDERHDAQFDLLVYPDAVFIGFADEGYPFLSLPGEQIRRVFIEKSKVRLDFVRDNGQLINYVLYGTNVKGLGEKIEFIRKRAVKHK
ncbi:hypothetical protein [Brevibacillus dissolubilis]|uniref:hypothetical protein n=1 Tax=Brevibacillus dissolubilis TaxID=1844116 RepID=UPI0011169EFC|nr:hypothetical protein [Brevibacillus dissolubilis]